MKASTNNKIEQACIDALEKFKQINKEEFKDVESKLEYVIGSFRHDQNPVGLYEIGSMALNKLKKYKAEKPRQVSQKLITNLEKALKS